MFYYKNNFGIKYPKKVDMPLNRDSLEKKKQETDTKIEKHVLHVTTKECWRGLASIVDEDWENI